MDDDAASERRRKELRSQADKGLKENREAILVELRRAGCMFDANWSESDAWEYIERVSGAKIESMMYLEAIGPDSADVLDQIAGTARKLARLLRKSRVNLSHELYDAVAGTLRSDDGPALWSVSATAVGVERFAQRVESIGRGMKHKRRVGRPTTLSQSVVEDLARLYVKATGKRPGRGRGPFQRIVSKFMVAHGSKMNADHVADLIQAALRPGRKSSQ